MKVPTPILSRSILSQSAFGKLAKRLSVAVLATVLIPNCALADDYTARCRAGLDAGDFGSIQVYCTQNAQEYALAAAGTNGSVRDGYLIEEAHRIGEVAAAELNNGVEPQHSRSIIHNALAIASGATSRHPTKRAQTILAWLRHLGNQAGVH